MLSNAVPEGVWEDTICASTDELRSPALDAAFAPRKKKQATLRRQILANPNPVAARGVAVIALASLVSLGACAGSTSVTSGSGGNTNVNSDGGGSGGSSGNHDAASVPLSCDHVQLVLEDNCTNCHTPGTAPFSGGLDLMSDGVAMRLVGKPAATATATNQAMCSGKGNLLNRGTLPATGILLDKLKAPPVICGSPMPLAGSMLAQEDIDCLQAWANGLVNSVGP